MRVILIAAVTEDGFIARAASENSFDWTSREDHAFFVSKTKEIGTMIMGRRTFETIGKPLPGRRLIVLTHRPHPDPLHCMERGGAVRAEVTPPRSGGVGGGNDGTVEFTSEETRALLARLEKEGVASVAVCGGAEVYARFLNDGLVDEAFLTVEPVHFGAGVPLAPGFDLGRLALVSQEPLGPATLKHYKVVSS